MQDAVGALAFGAFADVERQAGGAEGPAVVAGPHQGEGEGEGEVLGAEGGWRGEGGGGLGLVEGVSWVEL